MWGISLSEKALKFLERNHLQKEDVFALVGGTIKKFSGEDINVDIKKLKGEWFGFYRIRKGKLRIIAEFNFDNHHAFIEAVDWRGGAYK